MKRISILGSTGSIGTSTLKVVRDHPDQFQVVALAARGQIERLKEQVEEFTPRLVAVFDEKKARELAQALPHVEVVSGEEGLEAVATLEEADFVLSAITGTAALNPTVAALQKGKDVGLASKEVLVSAGALVMDLVKEKKGMLLPIDSEHSAIFQCLRGERLEEVERLILTSSGGPFWKKSSQELKGVGVEDALNHPTWSMGKKISVDSSTLMNKGLEVIEAFWLFGLSIDKIQVIIHPQSVIHSMVEFRDRSIMAQMGKPNMMVPIQFALSYPCRLSSSLEPFDFTRYSRLDFFEPNTQRFPCLSLAYHALGAGGSFSCYMNAANEILVQRFLERQISWGEIAEKLEQLMERHCSQSMGSVGDVLAIDAQGRREATLI